MRRNIPQGSAFYTTKVERETLVPGNVEEPIDSPRQILCYVGLSGAFKPATWSSTEQTESSNTPYLSKYDPALCDKTKKTNQTYDYMVVMPWRESPTSIKIYGWYYDGQYGGSPRTGLVPDVSFDIEYKAKSDIEGSLQMSYSYENVETQQDLKITVDKANTCGEITGTIDTKNNVFSTVTYKAKTAFSMAFNSTFFGNTWTGSVSVKMQAETAAVIDIANKKAQTTESTTMALNPGCTLAQGGRTRRRSKGKGGGGTNACSEMADSFQKQAKNVAGVVAFNDNQAAIQTAKSTALLGVSQGSKTPNFCLDRKSSVEYARDYLLFDGSTGEAAKWPSDAGTYYSAYYWNTTKTDRSGVPWNEYRYWWSGGSSTYYPSGRPAIALGCRGDRPTFEDCWISPSSERDLNNDGTEDGYYGVNSLPDGSTVTSSKYQRGFYSKTYITKANRVVDVPASLPTGSCTPTIDTTATDPSTLTCTSGRNGNSAWSYPTVASDMPFSYIDGVAIST
jgi:hypothetical protein